MHATQLPEDMTSADREYDRKQHPDQAEQQVRAIAAAVSVLGWLTTSRGVARRLLVARHNDLACIECVEAETFGQAAVASSG
jgi:hypothetical protein